jgi:hypothetical protein
MKNQTQKFVVVSDSEGVMSETFYHTLKDFASKGIEEQKQFDKKEDAESFVKEFNNGENDLRVENA